RRPVSPLLQPRGPQTAAALARAAQLQREAVDLLEAGDREAPALVRGADPACLHADRLAALPPARRARVLRRWIDALGLPPLPARGVAGIDAWLRQAPATGTAEIGRAHV